MDIISLVHGRTQPYEGDKSTLPLLVANQIIQGFTSDINISNLDGLRHPNYFSSLRGRWPANVGSPHHSQFIPLYHELFLSLSVFF
jgi:hypothetical protein